jgi:hypothetical protein
VASPRIIIDKSLFPLVFHTVCEGYGHEDIQHMFREYDALLGGKDRYALVIHFPLSVDMLRAAERKTIAEWWIPRRQRIAAMNVMYAMVLDSQLLRGGLTALLWLIQPGNPHKMAGTLQEGANMAIDALMEAGISLPATVLARRSSGT